MSDGESDTTPVDDEEANGRLAALEERIDDLETELERQKRDFAMLAVQADLKAVSEQECPECGVAALTKRSGFSWSKAVCTECDSEWYLKG